MNFGKQYCPFHNKKEWFVAPEIMTLHELTGNPKKACKKCVREGKLKIILSGQLRQVCPIHPDQHLWIADNEEGFEKLRVVFREALNPSLKWEQIIPKPGRKGKIQK